MTSTGSTTWPGTNPSVRPPVTIRVADREPLGHRKLAPWTCPGSIRRTSILFSLVDDKCKGPDWSIWIADCGTTSDFSAAPAFNDYVDELAVDQDAVRIGKCRSHRHGIAFPDPRFTSTKLTLPDSGYLLAVGKLHMDHRRVHLLAQFPVLPSFSRTARISRWDTEKVT